MLGSRKEIAGVMDYIFQQLCEPLQCCM